MKKILNTDDTIIVINNLVKNWDTLDLETKQGVVNLLANNSLNELSLMCHIVFGGKKNEL